MMKVALFSPTINTANGWGNFTFEYCSHLKGKVDFTLYLPEKEKKEGQYFDFPVKFILPPYTKSFEKKDGCITDYISPLQISKAELIHSLESFPYAISAYYTAKKEKIPYMVTVHAGYGIRPLSMKLDGKYLTEAYLNANFLYAVSNYIANILSKRIRREVKVVYNAVNYDRFQQRYDLDELKREFSQGPIILTVGRIQARKGQDIGIKAFQIVKKYFPSAKFILVGEDQWDGCLQKLIKRLRIEDIYLLGEKKGEELVKYYQLCDVFVHVPKIVEHKVEGFPIVYLEAGACGKPVIGSLSGGVPDAVRDNITGLLVPEGDVKATAKAIIRLLHDEKLSRYLGENGRKNAEKLKWENYVETMKEIYEKVKNDR